MPLALILIVALLFAGGGARTDLIVGAVAASLVGRRRIEAAGADPGRRGLDGLSGFAEVFLRRLVAAGQARLEEAELDAHRQVARHLPLREGVHLELETVLGALVG